MNRKIVGFIGLGLQIIGLLFSLICVLMETIVPEIALILLWTGIAIVFIAVFFLPKNNTDKDNKK